MCLNCNWKSLFGIAIAILIGYWLFLGFIPFQNGQLPTFDRASNNWAMYIDFNLLENHMWKKDYDPEGLFSTLPAMATCISGILIGRLLDGLTNIKLLFGAALALLGLGYLFNIWFPINKAIWSSSFVLVTSGWATIVLTIIYYLTDVKQIKFGSVFKYIGMNAITIYFLSSFISKAFYLTKIGDTNMHSWIYNNVFVYDFLSNKFSSLLYALTVVSFYMLLGYLMYRKKIFIKV